jgi:hypothetical protein
MAGADGDGIRLLLDILDRAYERRSWHGTNLAGSIRGLTPEQAARRPAPRRHNIWEIVAHAAYWKYAVRRRLLAEPRGSFPLAGSNWFPRPEPGRVNPDAWRADVALLRDMHRRLRAAVAQLPPHELARAAKGSTFTNFELIAGIAAHDLYHAGQIQLIKKINS